MREEQDAPASETTRAIENGPRLTHSTLFNLAGAAIPAALLLITVPIYLRLIGEARYGVLAIVWLLLGYFAVFDLGFGRAVANRIATLHQGTAEERQGVFWTGLVISAITAIVGGVLLYLLAGWLFADVFHVQGMIQREAEHAMPWLALALPLAIIISLLAGTLEGRQAFLPLNTAQIFGTVLYQIFPLATAALGWISLPYLIAAALVGRLLSALLLFILCYRYVPLTWKPKITTAEIKPLLRYGGWITLTGVVGPLLTVFDRFLIGAKIGMIAVTAYTVPYNLVMYFSVIPGSMSTALFPRFAMMDAQQAQLLLSRSVKIITALISPIVVIGLLLIKPFLFFWINNSLAKEAAPIGQVLLLGIWINALALIPYTYLQGRGRPDIPAKFHALELVPFVAVLWLLIDYFGLEGAAWAWDIRVIADTILLFWAAGGIAQIQYALIAGIPVLLAFTISITLDYTSVTYIWATLATFSISVGWSLVSLPEDLRTMLIRRLRNIQII